MDLDFLACQANFNKGRKHFHLMVKPIGPVCNLRCKYCYYLEKAKLYPQANNRSDDYKMLDEMLESYIKNYIASQPTDNPEVLFAWHGGEPTLLGLPFFEKAVALQQKYGDGRKMTNSLQTNGMFIDDAWAAFFKKHNFLIGISIDGPEDLHDAYRKNQNGQGSWSRVMKSVELLKKQGVEFNTLTVINRLNAEDPLRVYEFLKSIGSDYMQFTPIQDRCATNENETLRLVANDYTGEAIVTDESVLPGQWGYFLIQVFDQWIKNDVGKIFVRQFECAVEAWCGYNPTDCIMSNSCGDALVMEHNGDVYSCDHFVYPQFKLGNILQTPLLQMAAATRQKQFGNQKSSTLSKQCRQCKYRPACNGECPKHRFVTNKDGEKIAYLCGDYYAFFEHADSLLRAIRQLLNEGKEASGVMKMFQNK